MTRVTMEERFWSRLTTTDPDECWEWTGPQRGNGYGGLYAEGRSAYAHRFAYELHNGTIPDGMQVCHTCDNPSCCNPAHHFLGDHRANALDRESKGRGGDRSNPGERNGRARLTAKDVLALRNDRNGGASLDELAERFGINPQYAGAVARGAHWAHI